VFLSDSDCLLKSDYVGGIPACGLLSLMSVFGMHGHIATRNRAMNTTDKTYADMACMEVLRCSQPSSLTRSRTADGTRTLL
jgi:hypothetical protein